MSFTVIIPGILLALIFLFLLWTRVEKSTAATILAIISIVITLIFMIYAIYGFVYSEPEHYGYISLFAIIYGPMLIGVGLLAYLRDKKNSWAKISFIMSICIPFLIFLIGLGSF